MKDGNGLHPYQIKAINAAIKSLQRKNPYTLIRVSVGTGKLAILIGIIKAILQNEQKPKVLILISNKEIMSQIRNEIINSGIADINTIVVSSYKEIQSYYETHMESTSFQYVFCYEAEEAINKELRKLLGNARFIGFDNVSKLKDSWFRGVPYVFSYSIEDAVRDGIIRPALAPHYREVAIEGFCERLLNRFGGSVVWQRRNDPVDFVLVTEKEEILVEYKSYRNREIPAQMVERALMQIAYINEEKKENQQLLLILLGEVSETFKENTFIKHRVTIWDIANLLFYVQDDSKLLNELSQLIYFPLSDIKPSLPYGWSPQKVQEDEVHTDFGKINLEARLTACKAGNKHFREYEKVCKDIILYLFGEEFAIVSDQHKTGDKLFRMDLLCSLKGTSAFWQLIKQHYNTRYMVIEFKNHAQKLQQNIVFITEKYLFNPALRNVAIIISRKGFSKAASAAAISCLKEHGKLIMDITDQDLIEMLHKKDQGMEPADYLLEKLEWMLMSISK